MEELVACRSSIYTRCRSQIKPCVDIVPQLTLSHSSIRHSKVSLSYTATGPGLNQKAILEVGQTISMKNEQSYIMLKLLLALNHLRQPYGTSEPYHVHFTHA